MGLLGTYHLNNRKLPLHIFGPKGLDEIITIQLKYSATVLKFPLIFHLTVPKGKIRILEIEDLEVYSFPLKHRIPCTGFSFEEKSPRIRLNKELIAQHHPDIKAIHTLQKGLDVKDEFDNVVFKASDFCEIKPPRKYTYCSDTSYDLSLVDYIKGADLLYHESTFMEAEKARAIQTRHSTTKQAAAVAEAAKVKRLLLGHYSGRYPDLNPLLDEARQIFKNSILSEEGLTYNIK
jgi:ribonuclease Z